VVRKLERSLALRRTTAPELLLYHCQLCQEPRSSHGLELTSGNDLINLLVDDHEPLCIMDTTGIVTFAANYSAIVVSMQ
jgi:hypothetical protein